MIKYYRPAKTETIRRVAWVDENGTKVIAIIGRVDEMIRLEIIESINPFPTRADLEHWVWVTSKGIVSHDFDTLEDVKADVAKHHIYWH